MTSEGASHILMKIEAKEIATSPMKSVTATFIVFG
jgi:hypothetical protein